jgi:hypothetical protein
MTTISMSRPPAIADWHSHEDGVGDLITKASLGRVSLASHVVQVFPVYRNPTLRSSGIHFR